MRSIPLIILLMVILLTRLFFYYNERPLFQDGDEFHVSHSFSAEPKRNAFSQYFFVEKVFVSLPLYPRYSYGESIDLTGTIKKETTEKGELLKLQDPIVTKIPNENPVMSVAKFVRERIGESVTMSIPGREAGLLLGIVLGVRDKIDSDFYEKLRIAGVLHVVAASGQNVSILASILLISLQKIVKRRDAILFTVTGILFYAILSGFDPPIVRASLMALITFGAVTLGRQTTGIYALLLTGWAMVIFDPSLVEDISFQLSFLATWGIITVKLLIDRIRFLDRTSFLKDDFTTTTAAQIATFPLILGAFGSYSILSLPVNILILWTVPIIMIFGILAAFLSLLHPLLAMPIIYLCYPFLAFFTFVIDVFSRFDLSLSVENLPQTIIYGYYLILFGIVLAAKRRGGQKI